MCIHTTVYCYSKTKYAMYRYINIYIHRDNTYIGERLIRVGSRPMKILPGSEGSSLENHVFEMYTWYTYYCWVVSTM